MIISLRKLVLSVPKNNGNRRIFSIALKRAIAQEFLKGGYSLKEFAVTSGVSSRADRTSGGAQVGRWVNQYRQGLYNGAGMYSTHVNPALVPAKRSTVTNAQIDLILITNTNQYADCCADQALVKTFASAQEAGVTLQRK